MTDIKSWADFINLETKKDYFKEIKYSLLSDHNSGKKIYPEPKNFFKSFEICPYDNVKVVILGQDPYHTPDAANGLAFSVDKNQKLPPSLKNIFKEIKNDVGVQNEIGDLTKWAKQGVLLLNSSLTVLEGMPGSHSQIGWQTFTDKAVQLIQGKKKVIFMLWGNFAKQKKQLIGDDNYILGGSTPHHSLQILDFLDASIFQKLMKFLLI